VEPWEARSDAGAELDHVGPASGETVRQLACDAAVMRVVMSGRSQPLDVGRRTAVIPPSMRRAVIARDRMCRFPHCGRPHTWCDAHHVVHWADGGPTSLSNLLLLCRRHHRMIHRPAGFGLRLVDGVPVFTRPDGSPLEGRAPP
jgi:5-methylcytosine-specific restriction protein A